MPAQLFNPCMNAVDVLVNRFKFIQDVYSNGLNQNNLWFAEYALVHILFPNYPVSCPMIPYYLISLRRSRRMMKSVLFFKLRQ
jgi:hypothetical protein